MPRLHFLSRWDGYIRSQLMNSDWASYRHRLFDAAEYGAWETLFELLPESNEYTINFVRPDDPTWYTFLHHAALLNAPSEVVEELLAMGHYRNIRCAAGERPVGIARRLGHDRLIPLLEPVVKHHLPQEMLTTLESHFHQLILQTDFPSGVNPECLRFPPLELLGELEDLTMTFQIPQMFGGYEYRLEQLTLPHAQKQWILLTRSFCRILDGEELNRYIVTPFGYVKITTGSEPEIQASDEYRTPADHQEPSEDKVSHEIRIERAQRSLLGLRVGDAFGGSFFWKEDLRERIQARELPSDTWRWSDDTAMARCVVDCLERHHAIWPDVLARLLAEEYSREPTRGYGTMAHTVLDEITQGISWQQAAGNLYEGTGSCGNGAAMRVGPVGAYFAEDIELALQQAKRSAAVTHAHPEGQAGALAVAAAAAWAAQAQDLDGQAMLAWVCSHLPEGVTRTNLERALAFPLGGEPKEAAALLGLGDKITAQDTVPFALWCAARHLDSYPEALWATVSGLGDMDTTCAMVGSIVVLCAREGIPEDWLAQAEAL